jgi:hypothetical protein
MKKDRISVRVLVEYYVESILEKTAAVFIVHLKKHVPQ